MDVVGVGDTVAVAVGCVVPPGGRDELHRADRAVPRRVTVVPATVGVGDRGHVALAVEHRAENGFERVTGRVDVAASGMVGLDTADAGEQRPVDVAPRVLGGEARGGLSVGVEHRLRDAEGALHRLFVHPQFLGRHRFGQAAVHRRRVQLGGSAARERCGRGPVLREAEPPRGAVADDEGGKYGQRTAEHRDRGLAPDAGAPGRACPSASTQDRTLPPTTRVVPGHSLPQTLWTFHPLGRRSNADYPGWTNATAHNHRAATLPRATSGGSRRRKGSHQYRKRACARGGRAGT